jgi:hypothetical protein
VTMGKTIARNAMNLGDNCFESGPVERNFCPESRCCLQPPQTTSGMKVTVEITSQIHTKSPVPARYALNNSVLKNLMNHTHFFLSDSN